MSDEVFDVLAKELGTLAENIQDLYEKTTIEVIEETTQKMANNLSRTSDSQSLNDHMIVSEPVYIKGVLYQREIDWSNEIVDKTYGQYADVPRLPKKRNYSISPATWHDLAYIINYGRAANFSTTNVKIITGTYFVDRATRNAKHWRKKRDNKFRAKIDSIRLE